MNVVGLEKLKFTLVKKINNVLLSDDIEDMIFSYIKDSYTNLYDKSHRARKQSQFLSFKIYGINKI